MDKADRREMLSRFYQVDERERNTMEFKLGTPRISVSGAILSGGWFLTKKTASMSATSGSVPPPSLPSGPPQKKDLSEDPFKRETQKFEKSFKVVEQRFGGQKTQINTEQGKVRGYERDYQIEGSLRPVGTREDEYTVNNKTRQRKGRVINESTNTYIRQTKIGPELNREGTTRAFVRAGRVAAIEDWNKWMAFSIEGSKVTKKLAEQERAFFRNNYPIPPEPKDLPRMRLALEIQYDKQKAAVMMKDIEEMSYAAHGSK